MKDRDEIKNVINLVKRTTHNNTHLGIVDHSIKEISTWRKDRTKYNRYILFGILSLGIIFIVSLIWESIYLSLVCIESEISQADYFLIIDDTDKKFLHKVTKENFYSRHNLIKKYSIKDFSKKEMLNSPYVGKEYFNKSTEAITLQYKNNKYIYIESDQCLIPAQFEVENCTNEEIHKKLGLRRKGNGLSHIIEYNYLLNKFGKNRIELRQKNFCVFFIQNLLGPFFIYQVYAIIIWSINDYFPFAIITSAFSLIILIINSIYSFKNYHRILNFNHVAPATMCRDFKLIKLQEAGDKAIELRNNTYIGDSAGRPVKKNRRSTMLLEENDEQSDVGKIPKTIQDPIYIVPGDILELGCNEPIPCDCILLEGYCNVNESDLTGESSMVMKYPLIMDNNYFNYETNRKSILYHGTKISKCESEVNGVNSNTIYVMALNTGYNTNRGNLIQNLLFPKNTNFKFYNDVKIFFIFMTIVWLCSISYLVKLYYSNKWPIHDLLISIFDNLTVILPPILPICMVFTSFYFHWNLSRKNISCISDRKMNAAGRVNIIVLDKTGTLTEENLEIHGFQIALPKKDLDNPDQQTPALDFDEITTDAVIMNKVHKNFWKNYSENPSNQIYANYKYNPLNNLIYFVECLVTCHSIDKLKNDILGNSIDKKIFEKFKWIQEKYYENEELRYFIIPTNSYKITEKLIFNKNSNFHAGKKYKLTIVKRFEFSSKFQSMSVIVKNELDDSYRYFIKGAPEKIIQMCNSGSIPENFEEKQMEHTKNGFRVLACATKSLEYPDIFNNNKIEKEHEELIRKKYENNLVFLGFIIFSNKLKRDTKHVIANLKNSNCKLLMATGDNPFTSISVARECELIENANNTTYLIDLEKDEENSERLTLFSLNDNTVKELENNFSIPNNNFNSNAELMKRNSVLKKKQSQARQLPFTSINQRPSNINLLKNSIRIESDIPLDIDKKASLIVNRKYLTRGSESLSHMTGRSGIGINNMTARQRLHPSQHISGVRNYDDEFRLTINKIQNAEAILCVSGKSFNYLYLRYKQDKSDGNFLVDSLNNVMMNIIKNQGIIFYRMNPNDKIDLINFLKEDKNNIVAMCGDGANDCGALLTADIGISVRHSSGNSVTSHFYSTDESIRCVELIIRNGRACLENSMVNLKYMLIYGFIQLTSVLCLYTIDLDMSMSQYLYSDCLIALVTSLLAIRTGTGYVLAKESPQQTILNCKFISSIVGQILIQCVTQIFYFLFFITYRVDIKQDQYEYSQNNDILVISSYVFIYTSFQSMFVLFVFNSFVKHRKEFYTNKLYILYVSGLIFYSMSFVAVYFENIPSAIVFVQLEDFTKNNYQTLTEINRLYTLVAIVGNLLLTCSYEFLIEFIFDKIEKKKNDE